MWGHCDPGVGADLRRLMVETQLVERGVRDSRVLDAMARVPRHCFVAPALADVAYDDRPLPIGEGQTISQPYMVAMMTELLELRGDERVLEIGTGSGYQTAVLCELSAEVYTVERVPELAERAAQIIHGLHYRNVAFKVDDGTLGWPEHAPYDAILVTAGGPRLPEPLVIQLREGGRLVVPVGDLEAQDLILGQRRNGRLWTRKHGEVRFVPLLGSHGWPGDQHE